MHFFIDHPWKSDSHGLESERNKILTSAASALACVPIDFEVFLHLGMPSFQKSAVFLNIVQKAFDPPPLLFEHLSYFAGGVF